MSSSGQKACLNQCPNRDSDKRCRAFLNADPNERGYFPGSSTPWSPALALVGFVGLCLLVGAVAGGVTAGSVHTWYPSLKAPPGTPPNWLFGPVWGVLYIMMGVAAWLVWRRQGASRPVRLWGWQLMLNALWTPAFFGLRSPILGLAVLVPLLVLIALTIRAFFRANRVAAGMMVPYLVWTTYATYLNAGFWWLNQA